MLHPFDVIVNNSTTTLIVGTLPPDSASFYYSNDKNSRLWDILKAINDNAADLPKNSRLLPAEAKLEILDNLGLGICDIIHHYERTEENSVYDQHIIPLKYRDVQHYIENYQISKLLFVYKSAYAWFKHSLTGQEPIPYSNLDLNFDLGHLGSLQLAHGEVACYLLPNPLNRGRKSETLKVKLELYRNQIKP